MAHNLEYSPILVPDVYVPGIVQSLHLKQDHPSPHQLHKQMSRHFFAIGLAKSVSDITQACDTCTRLKLLPRQVHQSTTTKNDTFGTTFSADVLVEKKQHILLCREKLSQHTTTFILQDETKESVKEGLISCLLHLIPESGAIVQVDAGPSLVSLAQDSDSVLSAYNIKLDVGRIHNKQKNPVAENAIKEFRKEWLRLKPEGDSLSEQERAQITANMNRRIRSNGLAPKEFVLKRSLSDHKPITVQDNEEGERQFERREQANAKQLIRDQVSKQLPDIPDLKKGDLVYIIADLSKSRAREQYLVSKCFLKNGERWILVRKCQKGFRNVEYLLKASEVMKAPVTVKEFLDVSMDEEECYGFQQNVSLAARNKLKQVIKDMKGAAGPETKKRGRPSKPVYPDYLQMFPTDITISDKDE